MKHRSVLFFSTCENHPRLGAGCHRKHSEFLATR